MGIINKIRYLFINSSQTEMSTFSPVIIDLKSQSPHKINCLLSSQTTDQSLDMPLLALDAKAKYMMLGNN